MDSRTVERLWEDMGEGAKSGGLLDGKRKRFEGAVAGLPGAA
jgi:hypothetical protein